MAIQKEIWLDQIQDALLPASDFVNQSVDHSGFVDNITVHIPQAGTATAVVKDRTVLPATIGQRTDTDRTYNLSEYTTDPMVIRDVDEIQSSYDKRASILRDNVNEINKRIGDQTAYTWAGSTLWTTAGGQIVLTTGTAGSTALAPGATGTRKAIKIDDLANAAAKLDGDDVPSEGRFLLMPAKVYHAMLIENASTLLHMDYMNMGLVGDVKVPKIWGFNIIVRSNTVVYADAATPTLKAVGAATATTDHYGVVGWHKDYAANALGAIKVFAESDKADYYGSIVSAMVMHGSTTMRTDGKGIVTIVQDS